jgi:CRISPR-associated protein Csb2
MVALEIELLTGSYRATLPDRETPEWPPSPERVLSALTQAWGDGDQQEIERSALEWLECQPAPIIEADKLEEVSRRDTPTVFVPPNDDTIPGSRGKAKADPSWAGVFPAFRKMKPRIFNAITPSNPLVRMAWPTEPSDTIREALSALASRIVSIGHSASLTRVHLVSEVVLDPQRTWVPDPEGDVSIRTAHPGRLADLIHWHTTGGSVKSKASARYQTPRELRKIVPFSEFGDSSDWFVFEDNGGSFCPDILGFAHVAKRIRDALMSISPQPVSERLSGHAPDGNPTLHPHLAFVPLCNVGWEHSTGDLLGFAVVLPRGLPAEERAPLINILSAFARLGQGDEAHTEIMLGGDRVWQVQYAGSTPSRSSLKPERWCSKNRVWASTTPILLDRYVRDPNQEKEVVAASCRSIGLPTPSAVEIHRHSALRASPPASSQQWSFPSSKLGSRVRRHVVLEFDEPVAGPVILGAGRYYGFGLCLPLKGES